jgi:hypothetical protein
MKVMDLPVQQAWHLELAGDINRVYSSPVSILIPVFPLTLSGLTLACLDYRCRSIDARGHDKPRHS